MQKINPFLWFNDNAEDATNFYTSVFKNSKVVSMHRVGGTQPGEQGKVFTTTFQLAGQQFYALNGGPQFTFTQAVSFYVDCETNEEIDALWEQLSNEGTVLMPFTKYPFSEKFGWVQDKFGVSWQLNLTHTQQKIAPLIMFANERQGKAEEAINLYTSLFKNSNIQLIARYEAGDGDVAGTIKHAAFSLDGCAFKTMDTSMERPFPITLAISFFVNCTTQEEVDHFWENLSAGGRKDRCGWLTDKYGVAWQIVPTVLGELLYNSDPEKSKKVMQAMLKMDKLDIKGLQDAAL